VIRELYNILKCFNFRWVMRVRAGEVEVQIVGCLV
jgi:hypothetical protein